MITVKQVLAAKKKNYITTHTDMPVIDALKIMADNNIGSILITDDQGAYKGIFTERDYSRKIALEGRNSADTKVGEVLSTHFPHIAPSAILEECMLLMSEHNLRYLPVFEADTLIGIISIGDVVHAMIESQKETIGHLQAYINQ